MKHLKRYLNVYKDVRIPWLVYCLMLAIGIGESYLFLEQATLTADIIDASWQALRDSMEYKLMKDGTV